MKRMLIVFLLVVGMPSISLSEEPRFAGFRTLPTLVQNGFVGGFLDALYLLGLDCPTEIATQDAVLFLATDDNIPKELLESESLDGPNRLRLAMLHYVGLRGCRFKDEKTFNIMKNYLIFAPVKP